jgi:hypothetical protein
MTIRPSGSQPPGRPSRAALGVWPPFGRILYVLVTINYYYGLPDRGTRHQEDDESYKSVLLINSN